MARRHPTNLNNPNLICENHTLNDSFQRLEQAGVRRITDLERQYYVGDKAQFLDPHSDVIYANTEEISRIYEAGVALLKKKRLNKAVDRLCMVLHPTLSDEKATWREEKIGGIGDFPNYLYFKKPEDLARHWPKCGACHTNLKFVGQFNVLPWVLPLYAVFGRTNPLYSTTPFGGWDTKAPRAFSDHVRIHSNTMIQALMCPHCGGHFDNPNYDSQLLFSSADTPRVKSWANELLEESGEKPVEIPDEQLEELYLNEYNKLQKNHNDENDCHLNIDEQKITGWKFRLQIDCGEDWDLNHRIGDIEDDHPDIFTERGLQLLGAPYSQQTERRFYCQNSYRGPAQRMTPFLQFHDSDHDFSYQLYGDFETGYADFNAFGKVDGSCT